MRKIICTILIFLLTFPLISAHASYSPQFDYEASILYDMGLFKGTDNGFDLDKTCDRVQGAVLFIRIMGKEAEALNNPKNHPFTDVPDWASSYIGQMYYDGYTKGISETEYGVGGLTANQFATFCLRALGYSENALDWRQFKYANALDKMLELNLIKQNEYDSINSTDTFYRDFAVKLIYNSLFESGRDKQNDVLFNNLINTGAIDKDMYINSNVIELSTSEDIYALSRILSSDWAKAKYYANNSLSLESDMDRFKIPAKFSTDAEKVEYFQTASYKLTNDVDVVLDTTVPSDFTKWTADKFLGIGNYYHPFKGTFDGNNKTISMSSVNNHETHSYSADNIGFFGDTLDAKIIDTKIAVTSDMTVTSSATSDSLFAMGALIGEAQRTNINNCSATFTNVDFGLNISAETFDDYGYIGGLVGLSHFSVFRNCHVSLNDSSIYGKAKYVNLNKKYGGISVGGILGRSFAGSDNKTNLGRLGNQLYNCTVVSKNTTQRDVLYASIDGGTECTVGGIVGITYNNGLIKNCTVDITNGNISSTQTNETVSTNLGSAVGGIIGRMEHTGQIIDCNVKGDYLNITSYGADNYHLVGGIAGNAYGPVHRDVIPIKNCHFDGSGTSTLSVEVNTASVWDDYHHVGIGGITGYLQYQMYDSSVKNVKIINKSEGMKKLSGAGKIVGIFEKACHSNGTWTPGPIEVKGCTSSGVTLDTSSNVQITTY